MASLLVWPETWGLWPNHTRSHGHTVSFPRGCRETIGLEKGAKYFKNRTYSWKCSKSGIVEGASLLYLIQNCFKLVLDKINRFRINKSTNTWAINSYKTTCLWLLQNECTVISVAIPEACHSNAFLWLWMVISLTFFVGVFEFDLRPIFCVVV